MAFGDMFPTGIDIVFLGQPRQKALLRKIDWNANGEVALSLAWVGRKENKTTGYWFKLADFSPRPDLIDIGNYGGIMVCWKNMQGMSTFLPNELRMYAEEIRSLKELLKIQKKKHLELISAYGRKDLEEERFKQNFSFAKGYTALKNTVEPNVVAPKPEPRNITNSLFTR